ncbi:hypothetical protein F503_04765 [Ophiostoma piceae UAMH 11346]|uniref:Uncharacterized protein n=1 Tax=Ophiostoma piceae (strain UAMH 11346) TaxID=1262450 RepID=S3CU89_OPHP1|nr:hypothetical protein F503_04765 [Ophiostoma piceae UAMH 11346]
MPFGSPIRKGGWPFLFRVADALELVYHNCERSHPHKTPTSICLHLPESTLVPDNITTNIQQHIYKLYKGHQSHSPWPTGTAVATATATATATLGSQARRGQEGDHEAEGQVHHQGHRGQWAFQEDREHQEDQEGREEWAHQEQWAHRQYHKRDNGYNPSRTTTIRMATATAAATQMEAADT